MVAAALGRAGRLLSPARRLQLIALAGAWLGWEAVAASGLLYHGVVPSTLVIAGALARLAATPGFWFNLAVSLVEILSAIAIGGAAGLAAGIAIGGIRSLALAIEPLVNALASTPKVVFLPIFYLLFGIGSGSKIAVGALGSFLPVAISVIAAMTAINPTFVRVGQSFGLSRRQMATKVYLPAVLDAFANGLRIAAGSAIAICLIAETRFSFAGLGHMVIAAYDRSRFAEVYAVLAVVVALAVTLNGLIARIGRR
jgi:ABC-type nitrate/sulfonate/bicarbonate transport system permease component